MVVKRQCSFCANEIEPGTGSMFVKRDGTVFHFCSSSCRKQQLHLGRVGHRRKWTRAHAMKRVAGHVGVPSAEKEHVPSTAPPSPPTAPTAEATPPEPEPKAEEEAPTPPPKASTPEGAAPEPAPKASAKPRRRSSKAAQEPTHEPTAEAPPPS